MVAPSYWSQTLRSAYWGLLSVGDLVALGTRWSLVGSLREPGRNLDGQPDNDLFSLVRCPVAIVRVFKFRLTTVLGLQALFATAGSVTVRGASLTVRPGSKRYVFVPVHYMCLRSRLISQGLELFKKIRELRRFGLCSPREISDGARHFF